ncbi:MAG: NAD(P)H-dependent oxidoreductase [Pseudanabaenaceae cyanobacterium]
MEGLVTPEQLLQRLKWRYAVKKFDPGKKIPPEIWSALEESLVLAPSSFGLQPWKFYVITNPEVRQQLLPHSYNQRQVVDASHLVVLAINKNPTPEYIDRYMQRTAEVQGIPVESLEKFGNVIKDYVKSGIDINLWVSKQTYIALGQYMVSAAMLGIDTCPMEGIVPDKYDEILGIAGTDYHAIVACPAGYRAEDDPQALRPKVRFPVSEMVVHIT